MGIQNRNLIEKAKKIRYPGIWNVRLPDSQNEKRKATILLGYANMREEDIKEAAKPSESVLESIESADG